VTSDSSSPCLHLGDCLDVLRTMPDASVNCCVTSPPYCAVAKWIEESKVEDYGVLLPEVREVIWRLATEAERAEKGE
jgi:DNA modification methylase